MTNTVHGFPRIMTRPNGERWLVLSIVASTVTNPDGTPGNLQTVVGRRWIKTRQDWAKRNTEFLANTTNWKVEM